MFLLQIISILMDIPSELDLLEMASKLLGILTTEVMPLNLREISLNLFKYHFSFNYF